MAIAHPLSLAYAQQQQAPRPFWKYAWPWLLMIPMLAYAAGTQFSFQAGSQNQATSGGLAVAASGEGVAKGQREILLLSYSILTVLVLSRYRRVLTLAVRMSSITWLACLAVLSVLWSQLPAVTAVRAGYFCVDTLFVYWLVTKLTSAQIRTFIMMVGSVVSVCSLVLIFALPRYGVVGNLAHLGAWQGIFAEKNHAGGVYLFLLTPVVDFSRRIGRKRAIYAAVILLLLIMSESRTAWVGAALYPLVMFLIHILRRTESRLALILSAVLLGTIVVVAAVVLPNLTDILLLLGRDPTLTGRTVVWGLVLKAIALRPWLGYGYSAFWTGLVGESGKIQLALGWAFGYAHNGYLEILLQFGIFGLVSIAYVMLRGLADAFVCLRRSQDPQVFWYTGIILLTLVYNSDEETYFFNHHLPSFLLLVSLCGLRLARQQAFSPVRQDTTVGSELSSPEAVYS